MHLSDEERARILEFRLASWNLVQLPEIYALTPGKLFPSTIL